MSVSNSPFFSGFKLNLVVNALTFLRNESSITYVLVLIISEGPDIDDLHVQVLSAGLVVAGSDQDTFSYIILKEESIYTL